MIKILYQIKEETYKEECTNCVNHGDCKMSLQIKEISKFFDISKCKSYHYLAPFRRFDCEDEDFCNAVIKLIQEKESQTPDLK